ncbi:MAG: putative glycoside hydrolase, partial [Chloroflexales bacterium]|nr:putative glycoside hydrolase [Chloroflexales bacterium]
ETRDGSDVAFQRIDNSTDGEFVLEGIPENGYIQALAPGYRKAVVELASGKVPASIELEPLTVKSIYVTSAVASVPGLLEEYFDLIDRTELNAIVIDLKSDLRDDLGLIYYDSQVPIVQELGTARPIMDIEAILAEAKRRNIYTIARVHIFSHDNVLADAKPEWAAQDRFTGEVFADYPTSTIRYAWLDPWNRNVWDYNIQLSVEAAKLGFDEINFDYIRFPSLEFSPEDKERIKLSRPEEEDTPEARFANIAAVLEQAQRAINGAGAFLSVDVFGYTTWRPDGLIGQDIELMAEHTDYICPMIYPSHYLTGELGFDNPAAHPYEMILDSMQKGQKQVEDKRAQLRPWLQDFTLVWVPEHMIVEYGLAEVRAQIDAVYDFDPTTGWILYDSANDYTEEALEPAEE